jgi:hypothetical protein
MSEVEEGISGAAVRARGGHHGQRIDEGAENEPGMDMPAIESC